MVFGLRATLEVVRLPCAVDAYVKPVVVPDTAVWVDSA